MINCKKIKPKQKKRIQLSVSYLTDPNARKRAFVSLIALNALVEYFEDINLYADDTNCLYASPVLLNEFDVADIKIGNYKIDARAFIGENTQQIFIPRDHQIYGLTPDIYVAVRINKKLDNAEIVGFFETNNLSKLKGNENYLFLDTSELRPISEIKNALSILIPRENSHSSLDHDKAKELFLSYIDNEISSTDKKCLLEHLIACKNCRDEFNILYSFDRKVSTLKNSDELIDITSKILNSGLDEETDIDSNKKQGKRKQIIKKFKGLFKSENKNINVEPEPDTFLPIEPVIPDIDISNPVIEILEPEIKAYNPEISETLSVEAPKIDIPENNILDKKAKKLKKYSRFFGSVNKLSIISGNILEKFQQEDASNKFFKKIANKLRKEKFKHDKTSLAYRFEDISVESLDATEDIQNIKWTEDLFKKQSEQDKKVEDILASLDDIEVVDTSEILGILYQNQDHPDPFFKKEVVLEPIQTMNDEEPQDLEEMLIFPDATNTKTVIIKVASILAATGLLTIGGLTIYNHVKNPSPPSSVATNSPLIEPLPPIKEDSSNEVKTKEVEVQENITTRKPKKTLKSRKLDDVLADAFIPQGSAIAISNISWEVGLSLAKDPTFKNYLMLTGQALKMSLSKNLLVATDRIINNQIKIQLTLDLSGNIQQSNILISSGSKQIDNIVLQTLKETFSYTKLPAIKTKKNYISATLIINL